MSATPNLPFEKRQDDERDALNRRVLGVSRSRSETSTELKPAVYARFSDPSQKKDSIARQIFSAARYIESIGGSSYALFTDEGVSASHANRDGLNRLLAAVRERSVNAIVIEDFDRFSREVYDATDLFEELEKYNCQLHSATDGRALSKADAIQKALQAEKDRHRRTVVVTSGKYQAALNQCVPWGAFFGYAATSMPGQIKKDSVQMLTVQRIYDLAAKGTPIRAIARIATSEGRVCSDGTTHWTFEAVRRVLHNPLYAGRLFCGRSKRTRDRVTGAVKVEKRDPSEVLEVEVPDLKIVEPVLWIAARDAISSRNKKAHCSYAHQHASILLSALNCDCSGVRDQRFNFVKNAQGVQAVCNLSKRDGSCRISVQSVSAEIVERAVVRALREFLRSRILSTTFVTEYKAFLTERNSQREADKRNLHLAIIEKNKVLDRIFLATFNQDTEFDSDRVKHHVCALEAELKELKSAYSAIEESVCVDAVQGDKLVTLDAAFAALEARLPFYAGSEADNSLVSMMRKIVPKVEVQRAGRAQGTGRLAISVSLTTLFALEDDPEHVEMIYADFKQKVRINEQDFTPDQIIDVDRSGRFAVTDEIWSKLEHRFPVRRFKKQQPVSTRRLIEIAMLAMGMGISMKHVPVAIGDPKAINQAFLGFIHSGCLEILDEVLGQSHPAFPDGLPLDRFAATTRGVQAIRSVAPPYQPFMTDAEWEVISASIQEARNPHSRPLRRTDARHLLDVIIYKLRTGVAWHKAPYGQSCPTVFRSAASEFVVRGDWARALIVIQRDFPHLLDGADLWRMDRLGPKGQQGQADLHDDLTEAEWASVSPVLQDYAAELRGPDPRSVMNGILWVNRNNRPWTHMPTRYGNNDTCCKAFYRWRSSGVWDRVMAEIKKLHSSNGTDVRWLFATTGIRLNGIDRTEKEIIGWLGRTCHSVRTGASES